MCLITGTTFHLVLSILNYYILIVHFWVKFSWFSVKALTTNEATLPTFTCSASSNHKNIIHKLTKYCSTTNVYPPPPMKITSYTVHYTSTSRFLHFTICPKIPSELQRAVLYSAVTHVRKHHITSRRACKPIKLAAMHLTCT